ncbi:MAG: hypothetical protein EXQ58_01965 [Acidobacteria bacterium]|nr:hypothetical protein [Acidobacteriota bacterium]
MNNPARIRLACLLVPGMSLNLVPAAVAQTVTATLTGNVSDQSGAMVPDVKIITANQGTTIEHKAQPNNSGVGLEAASAWNQRSSDLVASSATTSSL